MRKIKLRRKAKRQLTAIIVMAVLGALMLGVGALTLAAGVVIILGDGWASALAIAVAFIAFTIVIGLGGLIGQLAVVHFR